MVAELFERSLLPRLLERIATPTLLNVYVLERHADFFNKYPLLICKYQFPGRVFDHTTSNR